MKTGAKDMPIHQMLPTLNRRHGLAEIFERNRLRIAETPGFFRITLLFPSDP